jgi:Fic family protein
MVIRYERPAHWIRYDPLVIASELTAAKSAALTLQTMPYQRTWLDALQRIQLKMEIAGTSRIEGADFTERELDAVLGESPDQMQTRSQRQAYAALQTYQWIAKLPNDLPITLELLKDIHRRVVTGADDDHCPPGQLRTADQNVTFGTPRHRGCDGGEDCARTLENFTEAIREDYKDHDPLIQALAAHYHFAAMHPFLDGNGRTARALEALMLQRAGLKDTSFIAMSNYYYDEKVTYLAALSAVRAGANDLTPFLLFALRGVAIQARRLLAEIQREMKKVLFRDVTYDLFGRLRTPRKRVIAKRQMAILKLLLDTGRPLLLSEIQERLKPQYGSLKNPTKALIRDITSLLHLRAVSYVKQASGALLFDIRLEWPTEITETAFFRMIKQLPRARTQAFS